MENEFVTGMILRTEGQIVELLTSTIGEYEKLLKLNNTHTVSDWMKALSAHAKENKAWVQEVYMTTITFDMYTSGVTSFLSMVASKQVDLKEHNYLGFDEKQLLEMFDTLQYINSVTIVDDKSMFLLAQQCDKLLEKGTVEYRIIRMLCISKLLGLYNITNVISKLIISQDNIKKKEYKILITPNIND